MSCGVPATAGSVAASSAASKTLRAKNFSVGDKLFEVISSVHYQKDSFLGKELKTIKEMLEYFDSLPNQSVSPSTNGNVLNESQILKEIQDSIETEGIMLQRLKNVLKR